MRYFVVPDLHGNWRLARELFEKAAVPVNPDERRDAEIQAVQLGDLANCVAEGVADDIETLQKARLLFDVVLVGNHEAPYFDLGAFSGFWPDAVVRARVEELENTGVLRPCLRIEDTLLTHAGVAAQWGLTDAREAERVIRHAWEHTRRTAPILNAVSRARGGRDRAGGIFWSDWSEPRAQFQQVHGHTVKRDGPMWRYHPDGSFVCNLDVGGNLSANRMVGLWLDDDGCPNPFEELVEVCLEEAA